MDNMVKFFQLLKNFKKNTLIYFKILNKQNKILKFRINTQFKILAIKKKKKNILKF